MRIDNNLGAMIGAGLQMQESVANIAQVANVAADPEFQGAVGDFAGEMVEQIPQIIAYSANLKSIEVQQVAMERLLDIKA